MSETRLDAQSDIYAAEMAFGVYSDQATQVRAYWLGKRSSYPDEVWEGKDREGWLRAGRQHARALRDGAK